MKIFRFIRFTLILLVALTTGSCAVFQSSKKASGLQLRYEESAYINYGQTFRLEAYVLYSNGKEKEVTGKDELSMEVSGAKYYNGRITIDNYPQKLSRNLITIRATYSKEDVILKQELELPFNYKGDVVLNFSGNQGPSGSKGAKGSTPLIFRDGNAGEDGGTGGEGYPGDNLTVYVWKDSGDFYFIKVNNLSSSQTYIYKIKDEGYGFKFNVNGGQGGTGGDGGDGGDGKNGSNNNNKLKAPGNGGKGGNGGTGGNGGKGGNVYIFVHPDAADIQSKFAVYNFGGNSGTGGDGGDGGKAGKPLDGQTAGTDGVKGNEGTRGYTGINGDVFQILVEEFDIEY